MLAFRFHVDSSHFENGGLRKRCIYDDHLVYLSEFSSQIQNNNNNNNNNNKNKVYLNCKLN